MISIPKKLNSQRRLAGFLAFLTALGSIAAPPALIEARHLERVRAARYVMGTILDITLYHHDVHQARQFAEESFSIAHALDDLLSNYKPESEINRLNRKAGAGPAEVSPELYDFLKVAKSLAETTGGAFDITIGPLMDLWQDASDRGRLPQEPCLNSAQSLVGSAGLVLYPDRKVELKKKGMRLDTGGIGKGFAVDRMAEALKTRGIAHALINFGHSSILAIGSPPHASAWRLLLQFPEEEPLGILEIKDQALSASLSLGGHFEIEGNKYGHLIDPKIGRATSRRIRAVVVARSASFAEAMTKYMVLRDGPWRPKPDFGSDVQYLRLGEDEEEHRSREFSLIPLTDGNPAE